MKKLLQKIIANLETYQSRIVNGGMTVGENIQAQQYFSDNMGVLSKLSDNLPEEEKVLELFSLINSLFTSAIEHRKKFEALTVLMPAIFGDDTGIGNLEMIDKEILRMEKLRDSLSKFVTCIQIQEIIING